MNIERTHIVGVAAQEKRAHEKRVPVGRKRLVENLKRRARVKNAQGSCLEKRREGRKKTKRNKIAKRAYDFINEIRVLKCVRNARRARFLRNLFRKIRTKVCASVKII